jgi:hypothetical protein
MSANNPNKLARPQFTCFRDLEAVFGAWPILPGENPDTYVAIGQGIWDARPPEDFIQATRISDLAYLLWEGSRLRRMKVKLIDASKVEGAKKLIRRLDGQYRDEKFWSDWALGGANTVEYVNSVLTRAGYDNDAIIAQTFETLVETLEAIERQSSQFEARRLVTIRDFDQYSDNATRRRDLAEERRKLVDGCGSRKTKSKQGQAPQPAPQLLLELEAAE